MDGYTKESLLKCKHRLLHQRQYYQNLYESLLFKHKYSKNRISAFSKKIRAVLSCLDIFPRLDFSLPSSWQLYPIIAETQDISQENNVNIEYNCTESEELISACILKKLENAINDSLDPSFPTKSTAETVPSYGPLTKLDVREALMVLTMVDDMLIGLSMTSIILFRNINVNCLIEKYNHNLYIRRGDCISLIKLQKHLYVIADRICHIFLFANLKYLKSQTYDGLISITADGRLFEILEKPFQLQIYSLSNELYCIVELGSIFPLERPIKRFQVSSNEDGNAELLQINDSLCVLINGNARYIMDASNVFDWHFSTNADSVILLCYVADSTLKLSSCSLDSNPLSRVLKRVDVESLSKWCSNDMFVFLISDLIVKIFKKDSIEMIGYFQLDDTIVGCTCVNKSLFLWSTSVLYRYEISIEY